MLKGWLVRVDFLDHSDCGAHGAEESILVPCTVWGVLLTEDDVEIHVLKWCALSNPGDGNSETWAIAKHDLLQMERIREEDISNRIAYPLKS